MLCNFPLPYNGPPTRKDQGVEIKCSWNGRTLYISNINMQLIGTRKSYEQHWKRAVTTQVCIGCIVWDSCYKCVHFIWYNWIVYIIYTYIKKCIIYIIYILYIIIILYMLGMAHLCTLSACVHVAPICLCIVDACFYKLPDVGERICAPCENPECIR